MKRTQYILLFYVNNVVMYTVFDTIESTGSKIIWENLTENMATFFLSRRRHVVVVNTTIS